MMSLLSIHVLLLLGPGWIYQPHQDDKTTKGKRESPTGAVIPASAVSELTVAIEKAKRQLDESVADRDTFHAQNAEVFFEADAIIQELRQLRACEFEKMLEADSTKAQFEAIRTVKPEDMPVTPELQKRVVANQKVVRIEERLRNAELELISLSSQTTGTVADNRIESARAVRDALAQELQSTEAEVLLRESVDMMEETRRNFLEALEVLTRTKDRLQLALHRQRDLESKQNKYAELVNTANERRREYERLLEQRRMLESLPALINALDSIQTSAKKSGKNVEMTVTWDLNGSASGPNVTMRLNGAD